MKKQPCPHWKKEDKNLCGKNNKRCDCAGDKWYCDWHDKKEEK